jgi:glycosyltransferase involved in cell wall biosynthesis
MKDKHLPKHNTNNIDPQKRILFIVQLLGPSGAEICAFRLFQKLDTKTFDAKILHYYPSRLDMLDNIGDIEDKLLFVDRSSSRTYFHWFFNFVKQVRNFNPDVVVCFGISCAFYGRLAGIFGKTPKYIIVIGSASIPGRTYKWPEHFFRHYKQIHIGVSDAACEMIKDYLKIPPANIRKVYNGISLNEFKRSNNNDNIYNGLGLIKGTNVVTCVASLNRYKNHALLLRAAKKVVEAYPSCVFLLVGKDGIDYDVVLESKEFQSNEAYLRHLAKRFNIEKNIIFAGPRKDVPQILSITNVFVMPSREEGLNVATIEAMAAELPVVVTKVGGLKEVVDEGVTGYLVPSDDENRMAGRIIELLSSPSKAAVFGKAGRERVKELFTIEQMAEKYQRAILDILRYP